LQLIASALSTPIRRANKSVAMSVKAIFAEMLQELKILDTQEKEELFNDDEFIKVTRIINEVAEKTKTNRTAKLELLTLAASMEGGNKASVVEDPQHG